MGKIWCMSVCMVFALFLGATNPLHATIVQKIAIGDFNSDCVDDTLEVTYDSYYAASYAVIWGYRPGDTWCSNPDYSLLYTLAEPRTEMTVPNWHDMSVTILVQDMNGDDVEDLVFTTMWGDEAGLIENPEPGGTPDSIMSYVPRMGLMALFNQPGSDAFDEMDLTFDGQYGAYSMDLTYYYNDTTMVTNEVVSSRTGLRIFQVPSYSPPKRAVQEPNVLSLAYTTSSMEVSPNPLYAGSNLHVFLRTENDALEHIQLIGMTGVSMLDWTSPSAAARETTIPVQQLPAGRYQVLARLRSGKQLMTALIVI